MFKTVKALTSIFGILLIIAACETYNNESTSTSDLFNQNIPVDTPEIFAPDLISKGYHELGIAISNDGNEIFYVMSDRRYMHYPLVTITKTNNVWSKPQIAEFARNLSVYTCFYSPDDKGLYFSTNRPVVQDTDTLRGTNNWFVEKKEGVWKNPKLINELFDTEKGDRIQSISKFNNIYITRKLPDRKSDIYVSTYVNGQFNPPEPLKGSVNSEYAEGRPFIARDESYLIFQSDQHGGYGSNDLWISFRGENNSWGSPVNLGIQINSKYSDFSPYVSPDEMYLFFSSYRTFEPSDLWNKSYDELMGMYDSPLNKYATLYWVKWEKANKSN
jgi:hypothetical protein